MKSAIRIRYHEYGKPADVLRAESEAVAMPSAGEVQLKMLAANINPSDFGMILGSYGKQREVPAIAGREGVAEVLAVGNSVTGVDVGERVRIPPDAGAWQEVFTTPAEGLEPVPADLSAEAVATSFINPPTAWLLLKRFGELQRGDWVVQNAANSQVGVCVIQVARSLGLRTLNVVRRAELTDPLKELGADVVVTEDSDYHKDVGALTEGGAVRLALNSVGGESAIRQLRALGPGGTQVTFGAMAFETVRFPTRQLIFDDIRLCGFWLDRWLRDSPRETVTEVFDAVYSLMRAGNLTTPIAATYSLEDFQKALEHASAPRLGKVIFATGDSLPNGNRIS